MPKRRDSEESKGDEENSGSEEYVLEGEQESEGKQNYGDVEDGKEEKDNGKHQNKALRKMYP